MTSLYIGIAVAVVVVILVIVALVIGLGRGRRSRQLKEGFGPEYDRTVALTGDRAAAERELAAREDRRQHFDIRALGASEQQRYANQWMVVQERFVDAPAQAVQEADHLVGTVMTERGYPMNDFDQMADDVSVDHPHEVADYRAAHAVAEMGDGVDTEQMRVAFQRYRSLFDALLGQPTGGTTPDVAPTEDATTEGEQR